MTIDPRTPIIVATGQRTWRSTDPARTPADALAEVSAATLADGGPALAPAIDAVITVRAIADSNPRVRDLFPRHPAAAMTERLGLRAPAQFLGAMGGNTPQYLVNRAADMLRAGRHRAVLLCGAELMATFFHALKSGGDLSGWLSGPDREPPVLGEERNGVSENERRHGLYEPINTYPLFENALAHRRGETAAQHAARLAELSSQLSAVAADNPFAWRREPMSGDAIATVSPRNRYIGFPYTRAMNAVLEVDMAAAIVLTTVERARELHIDPARWVYLRGGVDVNEIWHVSERADLSRSPAIATAWQALSQACGITLDDLSHFDIYSCFPSAVEIACEAIGLAPLDARGVTVTGGLPFFGGPGNNYSLHAIASMVDILRDRREGVGLVTANGLYLTKHSLGLYSAQPGACALPDCAPLQAQIDAGPRLAVASDPAGPATVESYTVACDRDGPRRGIFIARNAADERVVANAPADAAQLQALLTDNPIGQRGTVEVVDGRNVLTL